MSSGWGGGVYARHAPPPLRLLRLLLLSAARIRQSGSRFWRPGRQARRTRFAPGCRSATLVRAGRLRMREGTWARLERWPSATSNFRIAPRARGTRRERLRRRQQAWEFRVAALGRRDRSTRTRCLAEESGGQAPPCAEARYQRRHPEQLPLAPLRRERDRSVAHGTGSYCLLAVPPCRSAPLHRNCCALSA